MGNVGISRSIDWVPLLADSFWPDIPGTTTDVITGFGEQTENMTRFAAFSDSVRRVFAESAVFSSRDVRKGASFNDQPKGAYRMTFVPAATAALEAFRLLRGDAIPSPREREQLVALTRELTPYLGPFRLSLRPATRNHDCASVTFTHADPENVNSNYTLATAWIEGESESPDGTYFYWES